jgi:HECT-domain (ubiquitin-transferase)
MCAFCIIRSTADGLSLSDLLVFFTGDPYLPPDHLTTGVTIMFASPDDAVDMPRARTCNYQLVLPVCHAVYATFRDAMSRALRFGAVGFGLA